MGAAESALQQDMARPVSVLGLDEAGKRSVLQGVSDAQIAGAVERGSDRSGTQRGWTLAFRAHEVKRPALEDHEEDARLTEYAGSAALVYCIDASDSDAFDDAEAYLTELLTLDVFDSSRVPLVIALSQCVDQVAEDRAVVALGLRETFSTSRRPWIVFRDVVGDAAGVIAWVSASLSAISKEDPELEE